MTRIHEKFPQVFRTVEDLSAEQKMTGKIIYDGKRLLRTMVRGISGGRRIGVFLNLFGWPY